MRRGLVLLLLVGFAGLTVAGAAVGNTVSAGGAAFVDVAQVQGNADFSDEEPGGTISPAATSIPRWSGAFQADGVTYPFTMVGTDPGAAPKSTQVKVAIVPIDLRFRAGLGGVLRGSSRVQSILASPIFKASDFSVLRNAYVPGFGSLGDQAGPPVVTQYGDAVQKAMFWQTGGSNAAYHVTLAQPTVYPTQLVDVPAPQGFDLVGAISKKHYALVDGIWVSSRVHNLLVSLKIPADTLAVFVTDSGFLYLGSPSVCCVIGYHGATTSLQGNGKQQVSTYLYASYSDQGVFESPKLADVHALSHEVSEWYADPFVNNDVRPWSSPTAPFYGCVDELETGDPVVGHGFDASAVGSSTVYHPEDEALFSWFAREQPSRAFAGRYTFMQNPWFTSVAQGCS